MQYVPGTLNLILQWIYKYNARTCLKFGWQWFANQAFHLLRDLFPVKFVSLNPISKANFVAATKFENFIPKKICTKKKRVSFACQSVSHLPKSPTIRVWSVWSITARATAMAVFTRRRHPTAPTSMVDLETHLERLTSISTLMSQWQGCYRLKAYTPATDSVNIG